MGIWDLEKSTVIKLAEGKEVVQGFKDGKRMTKEQIIDVYGSPPIFNKLEYPDAIRSIQPNGFITHSTYFDCCRLPLII